MTHDPNALPAIPLDVLYTLRTARFQDLSDSLTAEDLVEITHLVSGVRADLDGGPGRPPIETYLLRPNVLDGGPSVVLMRPDTATGWVSHGPEDLHTGVIPEELNPKHHTDFAAAIAWAANELGPMILPMLDPDDSVATSYIRKEHPRDDAETTVAAMAATEALHRGWQPDPSHEHGLDRERAQEITSTILGTDAHHRCDEVIALAHAAVEWINATPRSILGGLRAEIDGDGFRIIPADPATSTASVATLSGAGDRS